MSTVIQAIEVPSLSKVLEEAHVTLSPKEKRLIDYCHKLSSTTWLGFRDERLVCVWGIMPPSILSTEVYLWLHTTEAIKTTQFLFIRRSQVFVQELLREYSAIVGHVKVDAPHSKKWLKWLGAKFGNTRNGLTSFRIERDG